MSIWNDIINSPIGIAIADGLKKLFGSVTGVLLFLSVLVGGYLLQDSHKRVSPTEYAYLKLRLDTCEVRYDNLRTISAKELMVAKDFFNAQIERRDSLSHIKDLEISRLNFIIKQYEKTAKQ